jgi:hypothetical protein
MTKQTTNQTGIYQLLDIKPDSSKMPFLLLPPIYALWLLGIGNKLIQKQNKSVNVFTFLASVNVLLFSYIFFVVPILQKLGVAIVFSGERALPIILSSFFFWFATIGMLTFLTVKYDRQATPDYNYTMANVFDYVIRFFAFFFWPFTVWSFQKKVNEYNH